MLTWFIKATTMVGFGSSARVLWPRAIKSLSLIDGVFRQHEGVRTSTAYMLMQDFVVCAATPDWVLEEPGRAGVGRPRTPWRSRRLGSYLMARIERIAPEKDRKCHRVACRWLGRRRRSALPHGALLLRDTASAWTTRSTGVRARPELPRAAA
jgi:hypothetical protein